MATDHEPLNSYGHSMRYIYARFLLLVFLLLPSLAFAQRYRAIPIPTRDGKTLAADLYTTDTTLRRPTILIQTPYNKNRYRTAVDLGLSGGALPYDSVNYNYVILDWRGFYGSTSAAVAGYDRGLDGYDAVEWIAAQNWSDGKVGTWGGSALGAIQFMTARHHPPHLVCAVPMLKDFKTKYTDNYYGGVFRREHVETVGGLGLTNVDLVLEHPTNDATWQFVERGSDDAEEFSAPMLLISGWHDHYPDDILRAFSDLRARSDASAREHHRLIMGPWLHGEVDLEQQGELSFPNGVGVANDAALRFFDFWLRNANNTWRSQPVMVYYQMGENQWRATDAWENVASLVDTLYLASGGLLSTVAPTTGGADSFRYDPRDPSPAVGGSRFYFPGSVLPSSQGPKDQRPLVESRSDLRIYTTPELTAPLVIAGAVRVELRISSDRYDTDVSVRLCDVYPDGRSMLITQGIRRLRFRGGYRPGDTMALTPGEIVQVPVDLQNTAITLLPGHRLRIDVASSCWPHFDLNPNTGGPLYEEGGDTLIATNTIHWGGANLSRLLIPVGEGPSGVIDRTEGGDVSMSVRPNPLSASGLIRLVSPRSGPFYLDLLTLAGESTGIRMEGEVDSGERIIAIDPVGLSAGAYLLRGVVAGESVAHLVYVMR